MLTAYQVIVLAFLMRINGVGGVPEYDFADNSKDCPLFNGTNLANCPQVGYACCS